MTGPRASIVGTLTDAAELMRDGMVVALGGYLTANKPGALIRTLIRRGCRDLTIISPACGLETDLLIGLGRVRELITAYCGAESLAPIAPFFRDAAQRGALAVRDADVASVALMLRAASQGVPFLPSSALVGSSLPDVNPYLRAIADPLSGRPLVAVLPVQPDLALLHAYQADVYGNVQHRAMEFADPLMARAATHTVVTVERIVPSRVVCARPRETTIPAEFVTLVVECPYGAHPYLSQGAHLADRAHVKEYLDAARARLAGDPAPFDAYLERYVLGPATHEEYLERVGTARLDTLRQ